MNANTCTNTKTATPVGNMVILPMLLALLIAVLAFATGCAPKEQSVSEPVISAIAPQPDVTSPAAAESTPDATQGQLAVNEPVLVKADPTTVKGWVREGRSAMERGEFRAALSAADKALELQADSAQALHVRGRALLALNRGEDALEALLKARELAPDNGYIANTLGYALIQSGRAAEALPHLEMARERLPEVAYVRNNLGVAYERSGERAKAIDEYRACVAVGDSDGKAALSLARLGAELTLPSDVPAEAATESEHDATGAVAASVASEPPQPDGE